MGVACAAPGCANPYLAWHHIGPDEKVALCLAHAQQATEAPADRLQALARASERPAHPGRPAWQRRNVLARVGGNFFYETPVILRLGRLTVIGFSRDEQRNLLLTLRMPTASGEPRPVITENFWEVPPSGAKLVCPPSGRLLDIAYTNGDRFRAAFTDLHTAGVLQARFGKVARWAYRVRFPVTLVELALTVANTDLELSPDHTAMGNSPSVDCFTSHGDAAIDVRMPPNQVEALFP